MNILLQGGQVISRIPQKNMSDYNVGSILCLQLHHGITSVLPGADSALINDCTGMR